MKLFLPFLVTLFSFNGVCATSNLGQGGLALEGYDPTSYFRPEAVTAGPLKGDPKFMAEKDGAIFHFSSESHRQEFLKNPNKYTPAFGGWCAYAIAEKKEKVEVDLKSFLIQDGQLLLFYKGFLADTRDKWLNTKSKSAAKYLKEADTNWPEVKNKEP